MLVKEGEGQLLKMAEQLAPHISLDSYADDVAPILDDVVEDRFQYIDAQKHDGPGHKEPDVLIGYIVIDDVLCNDGIKQVTACNDKGADHVNDK